MNCKHIAVLEICSINHVCMIENWIKIAHINGWNITVYTLSDFLEQIDSDVLKYKNLTIELKKTKQSIFSFLLNISIKSKLFSAVIITSLQSNFIEFLFFKPQTKYVLSIHNANAWFYPNRSLKPKNLIKKFIRKIISKKVDIYMVNSKNMYNYIKRNFFIIKPVCILPFSLRKKDKTQKFLNNNKQYLNIVYPGIVSPKRKDYNYFLKLAKDFPKYKFVLLGKINIHEGGEEVLNIIKSLNLKNITYFEEYVDKHTFDNFMYKADLIYSYIQVEYQNTGYYEYYGRSKDSGVSYLMIEYCLPLIVNEEFENFKELQSFTFYFSDYNSLKQKINNIKSNINKGQKNHEKCDKMREYFSDEYYAQEIFKCFNREKT